MFVWLDLASVVRDLSMQTAAAPQSVMDTHLAIALS
jgi:hypothetical protein